MPLPFRPSSPTTSPSTTLPPPPNMPKSPGLLPHKTLPAYPMIPQPTHQLATTSSRPPKRHPRTGTPSNISLPTTLATCSLRYSIERGLVPILPADSAKALRSPLLTSRADPTTRKRTLQPILTRQTFWNPTPPISNCSPPSACTHLSTLPQPQSAQLACALPRSQHSASCSSLPRSPFSSPLAPSVFSASPAAQSTKPGLHLAASSASLASTHPDPPISLNSSLPTSSLREPSHVPSISAPPQSSIISLSGRSDFSKYPCSSTDSTIPTMTTMTHSSPSKTSCSSHQHSCPASLGSLVLTRTHSSPSLPSPTSLNPSSSPLHHAPPPPRPSCPDRLPSLKL
ncbi:hypothetical protein PtA15_10A492 [Puccinia triticina]|uniref:REJ domain-containing protein n=1 Tax=Puccinia triticina TaxID=208348 RepID=A0ABY7CUT5_9BASI|nr:uncharacterized protein PtA15_10A492 [Puccinia triticina]WAQ89069.1 hypothetical protein PtA15_10A492 [Puccinia triticina]